MGKYYAVELTHLSALNAYKDVLNSTKHQSRIVLLSRSRILELSTVPLTRQELTSRMALFTKLLLPLFLFLALASCRSLSLPTILQTRDIDSDIATRQPTDDTLTINFSAAPSLAGTPSLELIAARRALQKLKSLLGPDALKTLVAEDIAAGNAAWHDILGRSSGDNDTSQDPGNRVLAEVQFTAVPQECAHGSHNPAVNFTAANFLGWFTDSAFNHVDKLWAGHPEHYYVVIMKNGDGTLGAELVEPCKQYFVLLRVGCSLTDDLCFRGAGAHELEGAAARGRHGTTRGWNQEAVDESANRVSVPDGRGGDAGGWLGEGGGISPLQLSKSASPGERPQWADMRYRGRPEHVDAFCDACRCEGWNK